VPYSHIVVTGVHDPPSQTLPDSVFPRDHQDAEKQGWSPNLPRFSTEPLRIILWETQIIGLRSFKKVSAPFRRAYQACAGTRSSMACNCASCWRRDDPWFASMGGEPARRRALRLRQAAHCLLPLLESSPPIDVRLGPRAEYADPGPSVADTITVSGSAGSTATPTR
jgi:hypothetical protein